jgi:type IX secretion system PorP/SprF family membrane protein
MKKLLFVVLFLGTVSALKAQQLPLYSQYMMNGFLLNPAIAGSVDYFPIRLTARQQWVGIDDAPSTQAISAHTLLPNIGLGLGGYLFNDKFGPISRMGVQAVGAYHLRLGGEMKLGFGLALKAFQFKFDQSELVTIDDDDPAINRGVITKFVPDADFGVYLYDNKFFVGLAATQLIQLDIDLEDADTASLEGKNQVIRHYFLTGGYKFALGENFELEPSLLLKGTEKTPFQIDFNTKAYYKKSYWLGVSYRSSKDLVAMIGVKINKFYIGYAFDYTFSNIKDYTSGSHEILIGFNVKEGANKGSSLL